MKRCLVFALFTAGTLTVGLEANAGLVDVTAGNQLPDLQEINGGYATPSQPISQVPVNQKPKTLFDWLTLQSISGDPTPVDTVVTSGKSASLGNLDAYIGDYIVVHWGVGQAGNKFFDPNAKGGFEQAFLIESGNLSSVDLALPSFTGYYDKGQKLTDGTLNVGGISGWKIFAGNGDPPPVPEPGTIMAGVFCLGLVVFGLARRNVIGRQIFPDCKVQGFQT